MVTPKSPQSSTGRQHPVLVWDLPTRLFHWSVVVLLAFSFVTAWRHRLDSHMLVGYSIFGLLLFRLVWGLRGGRHSRFGAFICGPGAAWRYALLLIKGDAPRYLGHNPLGSWSVLLMLAALLVQVGTGLFANDAVLTEGPLDYLVSQAASDRLTRLHKVTKNIILFLVAIHLAAVSFYYFVKRDNLIKPMITGYKQWEGPAETTVGNPWLAIVIALAAALLVWLIAG